MSGAENQAADASRIQVGEIELAIVSDLSVVADDQMTDSEQIAHAEARDNLLFPHVDKKVVSETSMGEMRPYVPEKHRQKFGSDCLD